MLSFKEFFNEVELSNNVSREDMDGEKYFDLDKLGKPKKSAGGYDLYQDGDMFFLAKDGLYISYSDTSKDKINGKKAYYFTSIHSKERGGFRKLLDLMMKLPGVKYLVSDSLLTDDAMKFYKKILNDKSIKKALIHFEELYKEGNEFSEEDIKLALTDPAYTIAIVK